MRRPERGYQEGRSPAGVPGGGRTVRDPNPGSIGAGDDSGRVALRSVDRTVVDEVRNVQIAVSDAECATRTVVHDEAALDTSAPAVSYRGRVVWSRVERDVRNVLIGHATGVVVGAFGVGDERTH